MAMDFFNARDEMKNPPRVPLLELAVEAVVVLLLAFLLVSVLG